MSVQYISLETARRLVLERLRGWIEQLPPTERGLKLVWRKYLLSPLDMLREVEHLTDIGKEIIAAELAKISEIHKIHYVVRG